MSIPATTDDPAFELACHLVETQLNGRRLPDAPGSVTGPLQQLRQRKARLIRAVNQSPHVRFLTEAFRVVDAAFPHLTAAGACTEAAVTAACGPLYGDLDHYRTSTQRALRSKARSILTRAITVANQAV
ncbi:hypothetical protein L3Q67_01720 [Saccharothrix sp. AJ9571]|nr:hypothetical protein L3Q67_01720 [Saccharothrix sp. AJ9571]